MCANDMEQFNGHIFNGLFHIIDEYCCSLGVLQQYARNIPHLTTDNYNFTDNGQIDIGNMSELDHRYNWISVTNNSTIPIELPIDMMFNEGHLLSIIVYSILMVISSLGNFTVLYLLIRRRLKSPSRVDAMLMHLAIADLLVTFLMMPLEIGWSCTVSWKSTDLVCRITAFFRTFGLYLSSFVLVCISLDRYFAVMKPMQLAGMDRRGKIMVFVAWLGSFVCSAPQALIFHVETHPNVTDYKQCVTYHFFPDETHEIIYSFMGMIIMYALPLAIIIFCYASIYFELIRNSRQSCTERFRRSNDDVLSRAKKKTLWMTITIVIVFIVCWTPFYVMSVWYWLDREAAVKLDQRVQKGLFLFACTNSCMNPIVYGLYNIPRRTDRNNLRRSNLRHTSISRRIDGDGRNSVNSTMTNLSLRRTTICISCRESVELPTLRAHNNVYR